MAEPEKTRAELIRELAEARQRLEDLQGRAAQRDRLEEELEDERHQSTATLELTQHPLLLLNSHLRVIHANRHFHRAFDLTPQETENRFLSELGGAFWQERALHECLKKALEDGDESHGELGTTEEPPATAPRRFQLHARRLDFKRRERRILLAIQDVSHREDLLELGAQLVDSAPELGAPRGTLRAPATAPQQSSPDENERSVREALEHVVDVFWLHDIEADQLLHVTPAYASIWGRPLESLLDNSSQWLDAVHEGDRQRVCRAFGTKLAAGRFQERYRIVRPDGSIRWIRDRAFALPPSGGKVTRVVRLSEDITSSRRAEAARLRSECNSALQRFLGGLSRHSEAALARWEAVLQHLDLGLTAEAEGEERLAQVRSLATEIHLVHDHMTAFAGQVKPLIAPPVLLLELYDLGQMLLEVFGGLAAEERNKRLVLWQGSAEADLRCEVDRDSMERALRNLLENCVRAGGHEVEIQALWSEANVSGRAALELSLRDNGPGFSPEAARRGFEAFYSTRRGHAGLGLTVARSIVEAHQGWVRIERTSAPGAEVVVTLPRTRGSGSFA